jgi:phage gp46-like protein
MAAQTFNGLTFAQVSYGEASGFDLVFDRQQRSFKLDASPYGNILASLFIDKNVTLSNIQQDVSIGGWAASDALNLEALLGSELWYTIQSARLTSDVQAELNDAVTEALEWFVTEGYAELVDVNTTSDKSTGTILIQIQIKLVSGESYEYNMAI